MTTKDPYEGAPVKSYYYPMYSQAADFIRREFSDCGLDPKIAIVLGSGWGGFVKKIELYQSKPYGLIPGFNSSTVDGHSGVLHFGKIGETPLIVMQGRLHLYEGYSPVEVVFPIRALAKLGINTLILTNAAGGINSDYKPADLALIKDHDNQTGYGPLVGPNDNELGPRFPDMTHVYPQDLRELSLKVAGEQKVALHPGGVYVQMLGPQYEAPYQIRRLQGEGADMVGMSTVIEAIAAVHAGMRVLGISCITNYAAGRGGTGRLSHEEVKTNAGLAEEKFTKLLLALVPALAELKDP